MASIFVLYALALCSVSTRAWSPPHHRPQQHHALSGGVKARRRPSSTIFLAADDEPEELPLIQDETTDKISPVASAEYGVSYIGGDPCGSKLNDDPFAVTAEDSFKPGLPDDMKDRIEALAAKIAKEQQQQDANND